ncbi:photoreceptor ankyrin repeat protein-like [Gigantopelta aegis]|uniref:photoreceptor ankyrin repeat protein-like n=1 Tax=Gigantopelta aegis TaxID=1735272 RepID=UPI001B88CFFE|nr:photoreceptor ankyrin repeat protein-like [Gigantopelta aegis]
MEAIHAIIEDNPTEEEINERDRSGRTGLSYVTAAGLVPVIEMLSEVPELDPNIPDKEGNTPLIFAAQAGHSDVVRILLQDYKGIKIDHANKLGFTALMKAAIQGRTDCARLLLYAGGDPKLRDHGRKLCAEEWARYVGRTECSEAISKFSNTKRFYLKSKLAQTERSSSVPDLATDVVSNDVQSKVKKRCSLRRKIKSVLPGSHHESLSLNVSNSGSPFAVIARCVSTPALPEMMSPTSATALKRPVSTDCIPRVEVTIPYDDDAFPRSEPGMIARKKAARKSILQDFHST